MQKWQNFVKSGQAEGIAVQLVSSLTSLESVALLRTNKDIFSRLVDSNLVKLETDCTGILLVTKWVFSDRGYNGSFLTSHRMGHWAP